MKIKIRNNFLIEQHGYHFNTTTVCNVISIKFELLIYNERMNGLITRTISL